MVHDMNAANLLSDEEIIKKIINGKPAFFEQLMSKYDCLLYTIARRYHFDHQGAKDLLQDTHIAVYCKLEQFKFNSTFKTWLSKIMIHKCLYKLKYGHKKYEECSCMRDQMMNHQFENGEITFLKKELRIVLQQALDKLPCFYKTVFILREIDGYSVTETANLLHISDINVRVRLTRAKTMLQKELKYFYSPGDF